MPSLGPLELFLLGAIALIVFGPQKLPEIARNVGRTLSQLRKMATDVREEFESELTIPEEDRIRPPGERRTAPEPIQDKDKDEVLKPGEPGPGDEPEETSADEPEDVPAGAGQTTDRDDEGPGGTSPTGPS